MKQADLNNAIQTLVQNSKPFVLVTVLGSKKETVSYTDKKTGKAAEFSYFAHKCTTHSEEADFALIRDNIPKNEDASKATRPSYKGKQVLVLLRSMTKDLKTGMMIYESETVEPIEPDEE